MAERKRRIALSLEESAWLCHYLAYELSPYTIGTRVAKPGMETRILGRKLELYARLSILNKKLMNRD